MGISSLPVHLAKYVPKSYLCPSSVQLKCVCFFFFFPFQVIKESAELVLSWVKTHSYDLGITNKPVQDPLRIPDTMIDVHLHLPAGAQKKDGPSAGVAMVLIQTPLFLRFGFLTKGIDRSA